MTGNNQDPHHLENNAYILYVDHQGHPAPLTECFHATATRRLSSTVDRWPPSTITEVDSAYCPQCLSFHDAASASRLGHCPKVATCSRCPLCLSVLSITASTSTDVVTHLSESPPASGPTFFFQCGNTPTCPWTSLECHLSVTLPGDGLIGKLEWTRAAEELATELIKRRRDSKQGLESYVASWKEMESPQRSSSTRLNRTQTDRLSRRKGAPATEEWSVSTLEAALDEKKKKFNPTNASEEDNPMSPIQRVKPVPEVSAATTIKWDESMDIVPWRAIQLQTLQVARALPTVSRSDLWPLPMPLRVRTSRRCRAELAEGRPGILLKPKLNPLEGDSSLRTGHGQWWKKDSSAIHVVPRVKMVRQAVSKKDEGGANSMHAFLLRVSNPTLGTVRLRFASSPYQGEPDWQDSSRRVSHLPDLLIDTLHQIRFDVQLDTNILQALPPTETVELMSSEDSIIELGGKARDIPEPVLQWNATQAAARGPEAGMRVVAQNSSDAWFELVLPSQDSQPTVTGSNSEVPRPAVPFQLQIELGQGSWESSLIPPQPTQGDEPDRVTFDLLLVWS